MSTDKRPIEERIAALMGKSAYCDLRDGFLVGGLPRFTDQDVAAAIGASARSAGRVGVMALETYYGSTLLHQAALLREWEDAERKEGNTREQIVLTRFGGALAIQQMAGGKVTGSAYSEYAYLIFSRREKLEARGQGSGCVVGGAAIHSSAGGQSPAFPRSGLTGRKTPPKSHHALPACVPSGSPIGGPFAYQGGGLPVTGRPQC